MRRSRTVRGTWALSDSNQRPLGYEPSALTTELRARDYDTPTQPHKSHHRSAVVLFQVLDDVVALVQRLATAGVHEVGDLVLAAGGQFVVGQVVRHVAARVARQARVVDDVGHAKLRQRLADLRAVRTALRLVEFEHDRIWAAPGKRMTSAAASAEARTRTWDHLVNSEALYQLSYFGSARPTRERPIWLSLPRRRTDILSPTPRVRAAMSDREAVLDAVRERVTPTPAERERLAAVVDEVTERAEAAVAEYDVDADVVHVGSTARDTWAAGDHDVDVFVRFPTDLARADLERLGLAVGREVLPEGHEEYAEHPYVAGTVEGFAVDLVPCYRVASASDIRSAVDRTPFHTEYVAERVDDRLAGEIRLFKQFLTGVDAYGSDLRTRGFSGFLAELLVLYYGDCEATLSAAAEWQPPVRLDPEGHGTGDFDGPLVVVDPTDPGRNVAAVVSAENVARLQHHARSFLDSPTEVVFVSSRPAPLETADVRAHLERRGTDPLAVVVDTPDLVDDQLYPQLRRSVRGLVGGLEDRGFDVLRHGVFGGERSALFVELAATDLPAVERHAGPPVHVADHAREFLEAHADAAYGPFIDGDRYVVERERAVTDAATFARDHLGEVALGARVAEAVAAGEHEVLAGDDVAALADPFGEALARYFSPSP